MRHGDLTMLSFKCFWAQFLTSIVKKKKGTETYKGELKTVISYPLGCECG